MALRPLAVLFFLLIARSGLTAPSEGEFLTESLNAPKQNFPIKNKKIDDSFSLDEPKNETAKSAPKNDEERSNIFTYHQAFSLSLGVSIESGSADGQMSFHYLLPSEKAWHLEVGAQVFQGGFGALSLGYRRIWNKYALFRPYVSPTIAIHSDGDSAIAEFIEPENFRAEFYLGSEYLFLAPFSLRIEGGGSVGKNNTAIIFRTGLSWAWY